MYYKSLQHKAPKVSFKEAVIRGIAPDKGLYFPESITPLPPSFFENITSLSNESIALEVIQQFIGNDIPIEELKKIVSETLSFDFPTVKIEESIYALELFHGPTMAFKDVGARFMARCLSYFNRNQKNKVTVLVATSGDTGGAVADGFLGVKGVDVVILYPSGKVSDIQEKQLTTLGQNITALEVDGVFDDCQDMVKQAFLDVELQSQQLTSANSINVARWLPQMFYFFFAYKQFKSIGKEIVFSVPSGNFGNICAGMMASRLGLPVAHFIGATNSNDTVPRFMKSGIYKQMASIQTISNAMDVGNPSNFVRIRHLFNSDLQLLQKWFSSFSFSDQETKEAMKKLMREHTYLADPHGAVGYLGLKEFLETAHPIKFIDVVKETTLCQPEVPPQISKVMDGKKSTIRIADYGDLKNFLQSR